MQDDELVLRLREGDEAAFVALVHEYQPRLLRLANTVVFNPAVAEEVVQDTWMAVYTGVDRFEGRSTLKTWLFHILIRRARSVVGREHRSAPVRDDELERLVGASGARSSSPVAWSDEVEDRVVAEHLAARIHDLLPVLPPLQRQALVLRDVEGLDGDEVATLLGITPGHLRVVLHRARGRVRRALEAEPAR